MFQDYHGRNLLSVPSQETSNSLMKFLINELFAKEEIIEGKHEQINDENKTIETSIRKFPFWWFISISASSSSRSRNSEETVTVVVPDDNCSKPMDSTEENERILEWIFQVKCFVVCFLVCFLLAYFMKNSTFHLSHFMFHRFVSSRSFSLS